MTTPVDLVRAFYQAIADGDGPGVMPSEPELEWTEAEGFPYYSGTWRSRRKWSRSCSCRSRRDWDEFSAEADDFIVDGDRVISFGAYAGVNKATGKPCTRRSPTCGA